jgi:hypothetical protein
MFEECRLYQQLKKAVLALKVFKSFLNIDRGFILPPLDPPR